MHKKCVISGKPHLSLIIHFHEIFPQNLFETAIPLISESIYKVRIRNCLDIGSLEEFDCPLNTTYTVHFKYADDFEEISDEIIHIPFGLPQLNLSQYIYEYIGLSVPMRKIHPKFADDDSDEEFDEIYNFEDESEDESQDDINNEVDPRWAALKNLKK